MRYNTGVVVVQARMCFLEAWMKARSQLSNQLSSCFILGFDSELIHGKGKLSPSQYDMRVNYKKTFLASHLSLPSSTWVHNFGRLPPVSSLKNLVLPKSRLGTLGHVQQRSPVYPKSRKSTIQSGPRSTTISLTLSISQKEEAYDLHQRNYIVLALPSRLVRFHRIDPLDSP